jgi:hypothetical protein
MIRFRLLDEFEGTERWQVEHIAHRRAVVPDGFAIVEVKPSTGYTVDAQLIGVLIGEGQAEGNGFSDTLIEAARQRWPGLRHPPRERFRP